MSFSGEESHNTGWLENGRWNLSYLMYQEKNTQVYMLNSELAALTEAGVLGVTEVISMETADQFSTVVKNEC